MFVEIIICLIKVIGYFS